MNGKISQKSGKVCITHIAVRLASFCLAVCVSVFAVSRSVEAADTISYTVESAGFPGYDLFYNAAARNVPFYKIQDQGNLSYDKYFYKVPLQLTIRNPVNQGFSTGVLAYNVSYNWDKQQVYSSGDYMEYAEFPVSHGEGYSWSFRPHSAKGGTIVVILDNYNMSSYGVPGPDWWIHLEADMGNAIALGGTYDAYDFVASAMLNSVSVSDSATGSLASAIASGINSSSNIDVILSVLNAIKSDTTLLVDVAAKLDTTNTALNQIVSNITTENSAFYWLLINAIKNANDSQAPVVKDEVVQDMENIGNSIESGESIEQDLVADMNTGLSGIDFNFISAAPTTVAGAAPWVVGLIYNIWSYMGPLQYLMTCALTLGLVFVLLASVNKKNKS